jgi:hypothetical protein
MTTITTTAFSLKSRHRNRFKQGEVACIEQGNSESGVAVMVVL